ncbi:hypothetical protein ONJ27_23470, partial [Salmonella enterica subsp. enterica serovar Muenster]|nr:hypothetical protein [Salmonella enterica subsp. enterica serovar Muenster]
GNSLFYLTGVPEIRPCITHAAGSDIYFHREIKMKSFIVISLLFLWLAFYGNLRDDNDSYAASLREGKPSCF